MERNASPWKRSPNCTLNSYIYNISIILYTTKDIVELDASYTDYDSKDGYQ